MDPAETNVYDMRLTAHQDGWIYCIFCSERHDDKAPAGDLSAAVAKAGIVRTRNLVDWERSVSYTHLDVYKRQFVLRILFLFSIIICVWGLR